MVTLLEIVVLFSVGFLLVYAAVARWRADTISELYWELRDRLPRVGRVLLAAGLAGFLIWVFVHLVTGG